jgi:hypothetical protein
MTHSTQVLATSVVTAAICALIILAASAPWWALH